ncbi:DUF445 domain-containing protein [Ramlibacter agri]|uniref:DUF445 domain-containing protein n=1 Tax=Ramlibacter agri TaxID=2728837 RepID=UPI001981EDC5|nr:DUF445 domain-containing protein [Ramlibacter agri]
MREDKVQELKRAKLRAFLLLAAAAGLFLVTLALPPRAWVLALRAITEAAMVGGLADWFAVTALFRRIPTGIPYITAHTNVISNSKDRIADNLAVFVKEKFLDPESLVKLIRKNDPAGFLATWLSDEANTRKLGGTLARAAGGALHMVEDTRIEQLLRDAAREMLRDVDLSQALAGVLDTLTSDNRHEELLEQAIMRATRLLDKPESRQWIARHIAQWLKEEYPRTGKALPTEWIGRNAADIVTGAVNKWLDAIRQDPIHKYRLLFDQMVREYVERLKSDPVLKARAEQVKHFILDDAAFGKYIAGLWGAFRRWLTEDLQHEDSAFQRSVAASGAWLGRQLVEDSGLREALTGHMEQAARGMAPDFAEFLTVHIRDTIRNWDARDMAQQIELNIGKDLQAIRINGTLVGGSIGLGLHLLTYLPGLVPWLRVGH